MDLREVAGRVRFARELHRSDRLSDIIQRGMSDHAGRIAQYLLIQQQRFLNSLVVAVYGGEPQFHEMSVRQTVPSTMGPVPELVEMNMGVLVLRGDERLMALDGQHRVRGIQLALESKPGLGEEQVGVIFVGHASGTAGLQRTRRLFTTLNRYAKPVSQYDLVAQDEDDVVAIVVRHLVDEHPVLRERISTAATMNLPSSDDTSVTTLPALYDAMDRVLRDRRPRDWSEFKRFRPPDQEIADRYETARTFWDTLTKHVEPLRELARDQKRRVLDIERGPSGGHLLLRPVGLTAFSAAAEVLHRSGISLSEAVRRLSGLPMQLSSPPWVKLLWNPSSRRMISNKESKAAAVEWLAMAAGAEPDNVLWDRGLQREFEALDAGNGEIAMEILFRYRAENLNARG